MSEPELTKESIGGKTQWRCNYCGNYYKVWKNAIHHVTEHRDTKKINWNVPEPKETKLDGSLRSPDGNEVVRK